MKFRAHHQAEVTIPSNSSFTAISFKSRLKHEKYEVIKRKIGDEVSAIWLNSKLIPPKFFGGE